MYPNPDNLHAVIQALEIPDCDCPCDLSCPCGQECPPCPPGCSYLGCYVCVLGEGVQGPLRFRGRHRLCEKHCPHCREECDCRPADFQPPCRHVLSSMNSPDLQMWLSRVMADWRASLGEDQTDSEEERQQFIGKVMAATLLKHNPEEYETRPLPPPLFSFEWDKHIEEMEKRQHLGWSLWGRSDGLVLPRLKLTQKLHRRRNGTVRRDPMTTERMAACG